VLDITPDIIMMFSTLRHGNLPSRSYSTLITDPG